MLFLGARRCGLRSGRRQQGSTCAALRNESAGVRAGALQRCPTADAAGAGPCDDGRARIRRLGGALWLGLGLAALAAPAAAQPAPAAPKPAPDPALEAARAAFEAPPRGRAAGRSRTRSSGPATMSASSTAPSGARPSRRSPPISAACACRRAASSTPAPAPSLQADAKRAREAAGFATVDDPKTGIRLGIPARLLPKRDVNPNGGGRWQSPDGRITLDTRAITGPDANLQALFERNLAIQTPGRQVTYKLLRPDFFVIAGETATGRFYMRYAVGPDGLRGFSIGYDKALAGEVDRSVVAIANSFAPFPSAARPALESAPAPPPPPPKPAAPVLLGSGLAVGPGRVITTAAVEACPDLRVGGRPPRRRTESGPGLTVFEIEPAPRPSPPPLAAAGARTLRPGDGLRGPAGRSAAHGDPRARRGRPAAGAPPGRRQRRRAGRPGRRARRPRGGDPRDPAGGGRRGPARRLRDRPGRRPRGGHAGRRRSRRPTRRRAPESRRRNSARSCGRSWSRSSAGRDRSAAEQPGRAAGPVRPAGGAGRPSRRRGSRSPRKRPRPRIGRPAAGRRSRRRATSSRPDCRASGSAGRPRPRRRAVRRRPRRPEAGPAGGRAPGSPPGRRPDHQPGPPPSGCSGQR